MGIAVAVQVKTGQEQKVADWFNHFRNRLMEVAAWAKQAHAFVEQKQRILKTGQLGKVTGRATFPGYIFVELHCKDQNNLRKFPSDVYQLLKSIPNVLSVFCGGLINEDEFKAMKKQFTVATAVELVFPEHDTTPELMTAVEIYNAARTLEERKAAEASIEELEQKLTAVEQVAEAVRETQHSTLKQVKAFLRSKKQIVRIPFKMYLKLRIEKGCLPGKPLLQPAYQVVFQALLKYVKGVMRRRRDG